VAASAGAAWAATTERGPPDRPARFAPRAACPMQDTKRVTLRRRWPAVNRRRVERFDSRAQ